MGDPFDFGNILRPRPTPLPNYAESVKFGITLRDLMDQRRIREQQYQLQQLAMQKSQQEMADEQRTRQILSTGQISDKTTLTDLLHMGLSLPAATKIDTDLRLRGSAAAQQKTAELAQAAAQRKAATDQAQQEADVLYGIHGLTQPQIDERVMKNLLLPKEQQVKGLGQIGQETPTEQTFRAKYAEGYTPEKLQTLLSNEATAKANAAKAKQDATTADLNASKTRIELFGHYAGMVNDQASLDKAIGMAPDELKGALMGMQWDPKTTPHVLNSIASTAQQRVQAGAQNKTAEGQLRDDYTKDPDIKGYVQRRDAWQTISGAMKSTGGISDLALINGWIRTIDPGVSVREGEAASVGNASGPLLQALNMYNRVFKGDKLTPEVRQDILRETTKIYRQAEGNYQKKRKQYEEIANRGGFDPQNVLIDYSPVEPPAVAPPAATGTPAAVQPGMYPNPIQGGAPVYIPGSPQPAAAQATAGPKPGDMDAGYRFSGGDPKVRANWQKVK